MKKTLFILLIFAAAFVALFEQSQEKPNMYIMVGAIVVFMLGLMQFMSKLPGRDQERKNDRDEV